MMTSDRDCYVFVALPGQSEYVVAGRFRISVSPGGSPLGEFVYGRSYLSRPDAVELDPVELRLMERVRTKRSFGGLFGALRDAMPSTWGGYVIEEGAGIQIPEEMDYVARRPKERPGAVVFAPEPEPPASKHRFSTVDDLSRLMAAADADLARLGGRRNADATQTMTPPVERRPKGIVEIDRSLWVAKFVQEHTAWNQARVEYAMPAACRRLRSHSHAQPHRAHRRQGRTAVAPTRPRMDG